MALLSGCAASGTHTASGAAEPQYKASSSPLPDAVADADEAVQRAEDEKARLSAAEKIIETAKSQIGRPYRYGGTSPQTGFDCSGFVRWSFGQHGVKLPRTSREQLVAGIPVHKDDLKPGDLLIFTRRIGSRASTHAGIYVGEGKFIHSPSAGRTVCIEEAFDNHYGKRFIGARRVILDADEVKVYARQQKQHKEFLASGAMHTVRRGQTLSGIARKYGVTVRAIMNSNNIKRSTMLQIGQKLRIPGAAGVAATAKSPEAAVAETSKAAGGAVYRVQPGDSVWKIARSHGISQAALLKANRLAKHQTLRVGQELVLPGKGKATETATTQAPASAAIEAEPLKPEPEAGASCTIYEVKAGDTVWSIATRHGVSHQTLLQANDLKKNHVLQVGQQLRVPGGTVAEQQRPASQQRVTVYSVQRGDTIWSLARKHGVSTRSLLEANNLSDDAVLSLGQKLRIPVAAN